MATLSGCYDRPPEDSVIAIVLQVKNLGDRPIAAIECGIVPEWRDQSDGEVPRDMVRVTETRFGTFKHPDDAEVSLINPLLPEKSAVSPVQRLSEGGTQPEKPPPPPPPPKFDIMVTWVVAFEVTGATVPRSQIDITWLPATAASSR